MNKIELVHNSGKTSMLEITDDAAAATYYADVKDAIVNNTIIEVGTPCGMKANIRGADYSGVSLIPGEDCHKKAFLSN